jgi:hypothetical protein
MTNELWIVFIEPEPDECGGLRTAVRHSRFDRCEQYLHRLGFSAVALVARGEWSAI